MVTLFPQITNLQVEHNLSKNPITLQKIEINTLILIFAWKYKLYNNQYTLEERGSLKYMLFQYSGQGMINTAIDKHG